MKAKKVITKLPRWAQIVIKNKDYEISKLTKRVENLGKAHELLFEKEWFVLGGELTCSEQHKLYILSKDHAQPICTIGKDDYLLVGRDRA